MVVLKKTLNIRSYSPFGLFFYILNLTVLITED